MEVADMKMGRERSFEPMASHMLGSDHGIEVEE